MTQPFKKNNSETAPADVLRQRAEEIIAGKGAAEDLPAPSPEEARQVLHDLQVHQIELEMQNEELRRAQVELDASRTRYFSLYDLAPVGYCTVTEQGLILEANLTAANLLGMTRGRLVNQLLSRFIFPEDQDIYYQHRKRVFETGEPQAWELRMMTIDGTAFWGHIAAMAAPGADNKPAYRVVISDITERKQDEVRINLLLAEKEVLLREVNHRTKNNMNVIMSLLALQSSALKDPSAIAALEDMRSRVRSMMILYDKLYRSADFRNISAREYLTSLVDEIVGNFPGRRLVTVETQIDDHMVDAKLLSPIGIIVNELLTNTMKHAFAGREDGLIRVSLSLKDNHATLIVSDNGVGIPDAIAADYGRKSTDSTTSSGFGIQLVDILSKQLNGAIRLEREQGTQVILEFDL